MITAKEFAESNQYDLECHDEGGYLGIDTKVFAEKLREFAKLHCIKQAKVISEKATTKEDIAIFQEGTFKTIVVDKDSIINAYDLNLIK